MTTDDIIDGILAREGENAPEYRTPGDKGGRTSWGISERAHPEAWVNGPPSRDEARLIYLRDYVNPWTFVLYAPLRVQLIDASVTHGVWRAVTMLQRVLRETGPLSATLEADGVIGPQTVAALEYVRQVSCSKLLNNAMVAERLRFIDQITQAESQKRFEEGWEDRALSFLVM